MIIRRRVHGRCLLPPAVLFPVPGGAMIVLEDLETALTRGARIYAEIIGGYVNCGGQRMGGSMTAPNPEGVKRCIRGPQ